MRNCMWPTLALSAVATLTISCSSPPSAPPESPKQAEAPRPADESRRFPGADLVDTKIVEKELMGHAFMPGGTLATYKSGKSTYNMFLAKFPSASEAAFHLLDWNKALANSHLVPSFGGYFGEDAGRPVFVFAKGAWIAGVAGLPEKAARLAGPWACRAFKLNRRGA